MNLVSIDNVSKNVKDAPLFEAVSFGIDEGEHIGFVGPNGSGKSTFLRLLSGKLECDTGTIARSRDLTISVLDQHPAFESDATIASFLFEGEDPLLRLCGEYERCLAEFSIKKTAGLEQELARLTHLMEEKNGFAIEHTYESLLTELGITDTSLLMKHLSGGMVKKAAMARAFTANSRLLLLDEPTNHLDIQTIEWLEKKLAQFAGAFVLITHDRYFLDQVCTVMLDIDRKRINKYPGNFSSYLRRKEERQLEEARQDERREAILRVELEWLKRGPQARALKDAHRMAKAHAMLAERRDGSESRQMDEFSTASRRLGGKILKLKDISMSYHADKPLISSFSYEFSAGERIGVIGPNGSGKSTLLDLIAGKKKPLEGSIDWGVNTAIGYFNQIPLDINRNLTVLEFMRDKAQHVQLKDGSTLSIEQFLERFLFPRAMFNQQLSYLSGGELRRLQLIYILAGNPNFLLFDEPTNDFDIATISLLEDFLRDFGGCVMVVSHDRAFLDTVTDMLFVMDGKGAVDYFTGNYGDYRDALDAEKMAQASVEKPVENKAEAAVADAGLVATQKKTKLTFKEKKEFEGLLDEIGKLEEQKAQLEAWFSGGERPAFIADTPDAMGVGNRQYEALQAEIEQKTLRWEELAEFEEG